MNRKDIQNEEQGKNLHWCSVIAMLGRQVFYIYLRN